MFTWLKRVIFGTTRRDEAAAPDAPQAFHLEASVWTDVGCRREVNEDRGRIIHPGTPEEAAQKGILAYVADGMGGHAAGEVASQLVAEVLARAYYKHPGAPPAALQAAFEQANRAVYEASRRDDRWQGMGTTCTALVLRGDQAYCAHVGDSRLYLLREGQLWTLSEDHSVVYEMVKRGLLSKSEARQHDARNVITRALGLHPEVEVTVWNAPLQARVNDRFLLCSDGLHDLVEEDEMREIAASAPPHVAGEQLVARAKQRGGYDNITVGLLWLRPAHTPAGRPERDTREIEVTP
jgi:protein phosphatase